MQRLFKDSHNTFWYDDGTHVYHCTEVFKGNSKGVYYEGWQWSRQGSIVAGMTRQQIHYRKCRRSNKLEFLLITGLPFSPPDPKVGCDVELDRPES